MDISTKMESLLFIRRQLLLGILRAILTKIQTAICIFTLFL
nr:MAG TPA: hypothetical protein [Caudoviricetes sp.]